ncbi:hypothetical protein [Bradyrhizobium sp. 200]|uniref:hypothetical protein n=1 Tax=Bradyrhizobium sp. 200 TaxID=2782665 RepID=UPI002000455F|nr:hypothetical protein [Bradyrhizobium sp. 200]
MAILATPVEESAAILDVALGRIDLALLTILRHAVPFEIPQMRVHRLGADELPSAGGSALRVELHHAGLHRHPSRPRARPAAVPTPRAPILERQRRCSTPPTCIEPAASLSGPARPIGVAARPAYGLMDLAEKAGRATAHPADPGRTPPRTTAITDLAGTDAEVVFVTRHAMTIESPNTSRKIRNAPIAEERRNTYASVSASVSRIPHIASDVAETVGNKEESIGSAPASPHRLKPSRAKAMCRQNLRNEVPAARQLALSCRHSQRS